MSFRSMEFLAVLIFAVSTASMTYLTNGEERERTMLFPDYYFFAERRLLNHTITKENVKNLDGCELLCYLNNNCVSLNFKKDPHDNHTCELNNASHLKYDSDLTTDTNFYYRGSKNACDRNSECLHNATCQSGFTLKGYQCLCPPGFTGEHCENDIDECKTYRDKCNVNAFCDNTEGSYLCICKPGYTMDGQICNVDPCHHYKNLSDADRKSSYVTSNIPVLCDSQLTEGWYRFVGAAGTKMPTTRVPSYRCGTDRSGWLDGTHPKMEDDEVDGTVCFSDRLSGCKYTKRISVRNCGPYCIYKLGGLGRCNTRYCATD